MRGGTSKGVFVRESDLPPAGLQRDRFILAVMGSPDPMQIDGLGGTHSSTSKLMAIAPSRRSDSDLEYVFFQVGIDRSIVDAKGNCGNLTAAVGAYAIDEGLVEVQAPVTAVRMYNRNTGRLIVAHVPVEGGRASSNGDYVLDGVPGSGAPIVTEYLDPAGAVTGRLFPTGERKQFIHPRDGEPVEVSIVDVTGPVVIVARSQLDVPPLAAPAEINASSALLDRLESIRAAAAVAVGLVDDEARATQQSAAVPRVAIVEAPQTHVIASGAQIEADAHDIVVRATSLQRVHHATPLTTAMCLAAACCLPGTVAHGLSSRHDRSIRIAHPKGVAEIGVDLDATDRVRSVSVVRTARRLVAGTAYVRADALED